MTAIYSLLAKLPSSSPVATKPIDIETIEAIVPAFNDQHGLEQTLNSLDRLNLKRIILVDDGSLPALYPPRNLSTPIHILRHARNLGAAAARNTGLMHSHADWIYFTDCGCVHDIKLFEEYAQKRARLGPYISALVGPVVASGIGRLAYYYTHQGTLNAPQIIHECGSYEVETIITANCIVSAAAIQHVGNFDANFTSAGAEDTDLGIRLRTIGDIGWCNHAIVKHDFEECLLDFDDRMQRYGRGMYRLGDKHGFDLRPRTFLPFSHEFSDLARRQYKMMLKGFDSV